VLVRVLAQPNLKEDFERVFFSDECTIEPGIGLRPEYSFIRPKDQLIQGEVQTTPYTGYQIRCFGLHFRAQPDGLDLFRSMGIHTQPEEV
jgi:hypothetical protein